MQVNIKDINDQSAFPNRYSSIAIWIIYKPNPELEIVPVFKSSDFLLPLSWYWIFILLLLLPLSHYPISGQFKLLKYTTRMEEIDKHLSITDIEISC